MNIVFLSNEYPLWAPGGVGTFLQTISHPLTENGHTVTILGVGDKKTIEEIRDKKVNIIRLPKNNSLLPNFLYNSIQINKTLKKIHQKNSIHIIEAAELGLALISQSHSAKKVIRLHGGHHFFSEAEKRGINWRKGWLEKRSFKKADGFIAVSEYVKNHTQKYLSYNKMPVAVINYPINTDVEFRDVQINTNHILFAGTVCEKKGIRQLLEAFKLVREKYPEKKLDIYGRDWFFQNGESYIQMLQREYDKTYFETVQFHGSVSRDTLNIKYAEAEFCVFPSHMETQGLVTLEAMLLKKPVIFSKYGPGPETIVHHKTGLLVDVYKPNDIAEKMIWCIENPEKATQLGINAENEVRKKYNKNHIVKKNIDFYQKLIANG